MDHQSVPAPAAAMAVAPEPAALPTFAPLPESRPFAKPAMAEVAPAPMLTPLPLVEPRTDIRATRSAAEFTLREYMALQRRRYHSGETETGMRDRLRAASLVELRTLRREVSALVKAAEAHRWRKWLLGGALGSFIPAVRALFRRPKEEASEAANDTEYAFSKSKTLVARILDSFHSPSGLAGVAFFVFAVLYVFQNEVSLRVARTVSKRLKRLSAQVEREEGEIGERELSILSGWRWRVLLWGHGSESSGRSA